MQQKIYGMFAQADTEIVNINFKYKNALNKADKQIIKLLELGYNEIYYTHNNNITTIYFKRQDIKMKYLDNNINLPICELNKTNKWFYYWKKYISNKSIMYVMFFPNQ